MQPFSGYNPQGLSGLICYAFYKVRLSTKVPFLQINGKGWLKCERRTSHKLSRDTVCDQHFAVEEEIAFEYIFINTPLHPSDD